LLKYIQSFINKFKATKIHILDFEKKLEKFQRIIKYRFKDIEHLKKALIHDSYYRVGDYSTYYNRTNRKRPNTQTPEKITPDDIPRTSPNTYSPYERMEFLGDSVLGLIVAQHLYRIYPKKSEGFLSKVKSNIVSEKFLSLKAMQFNLQDFIILGDMEEKNGGRDRKSIIADTVEAVICAIYLDGGLEFAETFIRNFLLNGFERELLDDDLINYKSILQEYCQSKYQKTPYYHLISETGPDHFKNFKMVVYINDQKFGVGEGSNKKEAQQRAAKNACQKLNLKDH
jgi:ribonuclease-3